MPLISPFFILFPLKRRREADLTVVITVSPPHTSFLIIRLRKTEIYDIISNLLYRVVFTQEVAENSCEKIRRST